MKAIPQEESWRRVSQLQEHLVKHHADGFLVTQNVDQFYITGSLQTGFLFVPAMGEPCYYVRRSVQRASAESWCKVKPLGSFRKFGRTLAQDYPNIWETGRPKPIRIATEFDVLPVEWYQRMQSAIPDVEWVNGSNWIKTVRSIKSEWEIEKMKHAAHMVDQALKHGLSCLHPGMREVDLMAEIEHELRRQGHAGSMRMRAYNQEIITGMIGSGEAAAEPTYFDGPAGGRGLSAAHPQSVSVKKMERNEPILIDLGCSYEGYVIDQTRTVVMGKLADDLQQAYDLTERILKETERHLRPGIPCETLYIRALEMVEEAGLSEHFMGFGDDQVKFLGHGIGMEIDELPVLAKRFTDPLAPGMVVAIEPKFTFPGRGVVGIENSYLITDHGFEKLTISPEGILSPSRSF